MRISPTLFTASNLLPSIHAHGPLLGRDEVLRRATLSKRCESAVASFNQKQIAKRSIKRQSTVTEISEPYYPSIQNQTCILTPDVNIGPYVWPESQFVRSNMSESQPGVPLSLDIGVIDMSTCAPLPDVLVSLWHANATDSYSSFTDLHKDNSTWLRGMAATNEEGMMEMDTVFPGFYAGRSIHIHSQVYTNYKLLPNGTIS